jgi:hypothetical protein
MDNRAALILLIGGISFIYWLHNSDRLAPIVQIVKGAAPVPPAAPDPFAGSSFSDWSRVLDFGFGIPGVGLIGSVNK